MDEATHELVVTARGDEGELVMRIGLRTKPDLRYTGYVERKARDAFHDAFSTPVDPFITVAVEVVENGP